MALWEEEAKYVEKFYLLIPFVVAGLAVMGILSIFDVRFGLAGLGAAGLAGGLTVRRRIKRDIEAGSAWPMIPWPWGYWPVRWPMAAFDMWTLGFTSVMALLQFGSWGR